LIEKLFDVACSLTDVLSLLPANPQPFTLGPKDHLHEFMKLLSVLRNGDNRFLPLLLSKVGDVLPTLANPMLQTVPDTPATMCAEVDIFDGYGPMAGLGVPSNYHAMSNSSSSDFKMPSQDFKMESPPGMSFDRRLEEISSPIHPEGNEQSPFTSPPIIQSSNEFPGLSDYGGFPDIHGPHTAYHLPSSLGNFGEGVGGGGRQTDFKREFDGALGLVPSSGNVNVRRPPPLRQASSSSFGMQIPRSIPDQFHQLHRANSNERGMAMGDGVNDIPFR